MKTDMSYLNEEKFCLIANFKKIFHNFAFNSLNMSQNLRLFLYSVLKHLQKIVLRGRFFLKIFHYRCMAKNVFFKK